MTLKEKFEEWYNNFPCRITHEDEINDLEKIADEFAIGFAEWKEVNASQDINGNYYGESRIGVSRNTPVDIHQLLEIYKIKL